jgi:hypothetical protein
LRRRWPLGSAQIERRQDQHRQASRGMTFWPLLASTGLYLATAYGFYRDGNGPLAVAFLGYAGANVGFLWAAWPK